jgi:putative transcriptional regulator
MNSTIKKRYTAKLLAANPSNPKDSYSQSVLLLTSHKDVAVGIQINYAYATITLDSVVKGMDIEWTTQDELWFGGVHFPNRVHVVHTTDWLGDNSVQLSEDLAITSDISVLAALAKGHGPERYRACAGHYAWESEDLEFQLSRPSEEPTKPRYRWEIAPATTELVFDYRGADQWRQTLMESVKYQVSEYF